MSRIKTTPLPGKWAVRVSGAVIAETGNALKLDGTENTVLFPKADIAMAFLDPSEGPSDDPSRSFFDIAARAGSLPNAAWAFVGDVAPDLQDHVAFEETPNIAVESVNG